MKKFLIITLSVVIIVGLLSKISFATPVSFSFGGGFSISDSSPGDGFSEFVDLYTGRIFAADPTPDPILISGGYTSKNRIEIAEIGSLHLAGTWYIDNGGTPDTFDDYTVFPFSPTSYSNGFKVKDPLGLTDYLTADLEALTLRTRGGTGNINANELKINLTNINLTPDGIALNSNILNSIAASSRGDILTVTMQYSGNLEYAIKSGLTINASYSGTVSNPPTGGGGQEEPPTVPEPSSLILISLGIIGIVVSQIVARVRHS